ncbi:MAG: hypothetical protein OXO50_13600 [Caldilineaceae bacterium]|nr:hypothetical protein [Caldilineaceae bacterium]
MTTTATVDRSVNGDTGSRRFSILAGRDINRETYVEEWAEAGLTVADSPYDPQPSLRIVDGQVVEMDGKERADFDALDRFIADHALDLAVAEEAMATPPHQMARMLVDINVPQPTIRRLADGCTPAKLCEIVRHMNVLEMMMGLGKMRVRKTPANQAHVTNWRENPALLAADAAEAALRGFAEIETTVRVARAAPLNALAILVGSQTSRGGVLTQCAVEEAFGLRLGIKGLTSYAETLSVYGSERSFVDGDDTPWSKAFLASAYASRGIKVRFTSGTGSEALMGYAEQCSMLYLEARCLLITKGAGSQGVQNGSISCIALMLQMIPGTDFICSGYSAIPKQDNMFGGGNFDAEDFDDWTVIQRDMQVNGGIRPVKEADAIAARRQAAQALQAIYAELDFPPIGDEEVEAAALAHSSEDMPERDMVADLAAADRFLEGTANLSDVVRALHRSGFEQAAANLLEMGRQRVAGDYLQPSAIFADGFNVISAINDNNDYTGPGTGYRLEGETWDALQRIPQQKSPRDFIDAQVGEPLPNLAEISTAKVGATANEIVVAVGPAYGTSLVKTIGELDHEEVLEALLTGVAEEEFYGRVVRVYHSADCAAIGHAGARLSGSGIAVGLQSRGTTVIQKRGLAPLNNLELFPQSPSLTLEIYQAIGRNAARYAKGLSPLPVGVKVDNGARLRLIVKTALLHRREIDDIQEKAPQELYFRWEPDV